MDMGVIFRYKVVDRIFKLIEFVGELLDNDQTVEVAAVKNDVIAVNVGGHLFGFDAEAVGVHDGGGVADDNFGGLNFFSEQHHAGGTVGDKSDDHKRPFFREQAKAVISLLVSLKIDTEQRRALIYGRAVNGAGCFVHFVHGAHQGDRFAVGLCELPDNVS